MKKSLGELKKECGSYFKIVKRLHNRGVFKNLDMLEENGDVNAMIIFFHNIFFPSEQTKSLITYNEKIGDCSKDSESKDMVFTTEAEISPFVEKYLVGKFESFMRKHIDVFVKPVDVKSLNGFLSFLNTRERRNLLSVFKGEIRVLPNVEIRAHLLEDDREVSLPDDFESFISGDKGKYVYELDTETLAYIKVAVSVQDIRVGDNVQVYLRNNVDGSGMRYVKSENGDEYTISALETPESSKKILFKDEYELRKYLLGKRDFVVDSIKKVDAEKERLSLVLKSIDENESKLKAKNDIFSGHNESGQGSESNKDSESV